MTDIKPDEKTPKPRKTKDAWKKRKVHEDVTLPSGQVVDIQLPNLSQLLKAGDIPNPLADAAIEFENTRDEKVTKERLIESFDFLCFIVPRTVISPEITPEDVESMEIPAEDLDMIASFIARATDMDAVGHQLGGLETNRAFRRFRNIIDWDEVAADVS
jgi:hypothetical protein